MFFQLPLRHMVCGFPGLLLSNQGLIIFCKPNLQTVCVPMRWHLDENLTNNQQRRMHTRLGIFRNCLFPLLMSEYEDTHTVGQGHGPECVLLLPWNERERQEAKFGIFCWFMGRPVVANSTVRKSQGVGYRVSKRLRSHTALSLYIIEERFLFQIFFLSHFFSS